MTNIDLNSPEMQALLDKIEKLLRLASNNDNEHQAAAAAAKAQDLLAAFNLDMSVIESRGGDKGRREDRKLSGGLYKWQRSLWEEVAQLNFCLYWSIKGLTKGAKYEHRVLGRTVNILSTRMMAEYLQYAIERITRDHYSNDPSAYFSKAGIAYREGMAARICERLRDRRREQMTEARNKAAEEKARASHPAYAGTPTANALTIIDVKRSEWDANREFEHDLKYGAGAWQREQQSMREWRAEYDRQRQEERDAEERFKLGHPEEWAKQQAAEAKRREAERKREERNARRRKGRFYYEKGPRHEDYYSGHERGGSVSLDQQIGKSATREIK